MSDIPRRAGIAAAVLLLLGGARLAGPAAAVSIEGKTARKLEAQARRLAHENICRRAEAQLAEGDRFYLVLDTEERSLSLRLKGALLREVALDSVEVGRPRRLLAERGTPGPVRGGAHRHGRLVPTRPLLRFPVEIPENVDEDRPTTMLSPEPETAIAVPRRFFIRYEGGVVLEFRTGPGWPGLGRRIADGFSTLFGEPELRLLLVLDGAAAEAFYRSVPPDTDLLVR